MSKKITKISKLKNLESFLQINYLKGYKYIDKVGEVLNLYQSELGAIAYDMSPQRLIIPRPVSGIEEMKISNVDLWCHYNSPRNLGETARMFVSEAEKLLQIIDVEDVTRIGWRSYYVSELAKSPQNLNSLSNLSAGSIQEIHLEKDLSDGLKSTARIKLLKQKNKRGMVLFFDLDVYIEKRIMLKEALTAYRKLKVAIESDEILDLVNEIILKIDK